MAGRRCADWRFPTEKQAKAEETARLMMRAAQGVRRQEAASTPAFLPPPDAADVRNSGGNRRSGPASLPPADVSFVGQDARSDPRTLHPAGLRTPSFDDPGPAGELPDAYWDAVLEDPRAAGRPWLPVSQMRLSEIPREILRVECLRCFRCVEIQRLDAVKLFGPHAVWKDVGNRLLDNGCQVRTGRHEEDGCWPDFR